jgi:signal transduction histidine kinase
MGGRATAIVAAAVSWGAAAVFALDPSLRFAFARPGPEAAFETVAALLALLAVFLAFARLRRRGSRTDLLLAAALSVIALSNLFFGAVPTLAGTATSSFAAWSALVSLCFGSLLFGAAAFAPSRSPRPPPAVRATALACATGCPALAIFLVWLTGVHLRMPATLPPAAGVTGRSVLDPDPALLALEVLTAVVDGAAAAVYLYKARKTGEEFYGWLSFAAVFAAAAHISFFHPSLYIQTVSAGDVFRLCFYLLLVVGSMREMWTHWLTVPQSMVADERRRIARDLHDGLAQELAYLLRNLKSLNGTVDAEAKARLLHAAERAQLEARLAVATLGASRKQPVDVAIAQVVGEVAARDHIKLELDVIPDMRLPAGRAEALVRIACEAVGNAAHHSGADGVSLSLRRDGSRVRLRVRDSGSGFDPDAPAPGFGLISMRERASSVGGDLRISTVPGQGTEVEATL